MHSLPLFVKLAGRPVILVGTGETADAKRRLLERAGARIVGEEEAAALAIVVLEGEVEGRKTVERLKTRGILVNVVDRPDLCDFTLPAIVDRDPVIIAIGTGGASAGLAKALRQRIEALLPPGVGRLAAALGASRDAIKTRWPQAADRRRAIDTALASGGALDPLSDFNENNIKQWLNGNSDGSERSRQASISVTSYDPDTLTLRDARLLGEADRIYHHPDVPPAVLARARADAIRIEASGFPAVLPDGLSLWLDWSGGV